MKINLFPRTEKQQRAHALERIFKNEDRVQMLDVLASKEEELKELKINRRWLEPKDKEKYNEVNKVTDRVLCFVS